MNKDTARRIGRSAAFLALLVLLLAALSWLYRPRDNTKAGGMDYVMAHGYLGHRAEELDVFFVGSSEFYSAISPMLLWEQAGITSYDDAIGAQRTYNMAVMVDELLKTHHPKVIVLDGYVALKRGNPDEALFALTASRLGVLNNHENWKKFDLEALSSPVEYTHREINKGFRPDGRAEEAKQGEYMETSDRVMRMPLMNRLFLDCIRARCQREGITLLFLALPSPENWDMAHHDALQAYADRTGIPLLDLNLMTQELEIDPAQDYRDGGDHLNIKGAEKVSAYLAQYLPGAFGLTDHRGQEGYELWQEELAEYPEW